jgi:hypothetical protein
VGCPSGDHAAAIVDGRCRSTAEVHAVRVTGPPGVDPIAPSSPSPSDVRGLLSAVRLRDLMERIALHSWCADWTERLA